MNNLNIIYYFLRFKINRLLASVMFHTTGFDSKSRINLKGWFLKKQLDICLTKETFLLKDKTIIID